VKLYTAGYQSRSTKTKDKVASLIEALKESGVKTLVDIRHSPCSSQTDPETKSNYGPKDFNLQTEGKGIAYHLELEGIEYFWLVELGNPQKNDPKMAVLREHIASGDTKWPVNRGLELLYQIVQEKDWPCCLLCACEDYEKCHRKVIAEAFRDRFFSGNLDICGFEEKR
jgi:uncharacterized protein (DUF488 family)